MKFNITLVFIIAPLTLILAGIISAELISDIIGRSSIADTTDGLTAGLIWTFIAIAVILLCAFVLLIRFIVRKTPVRSIARKLLMLDMILGVLFFSLVYGVQKDCLSVKQSGVVAVKNISSFDLNDVHVVLPYNDCSEHTKTRLGSLSPGETKYIGLDIDCREKFGNCVVSAHSIWGKQLQTIHCKALR